MENQIFYFKKNNAYVAICPGQYSETVHFYAPDGDYKPACFAGIDFSSSSGSDIVMFNFYQSVEQEYSVIDRGEYLRARLNAFIQITGFFGDYQQFQELPTEQERNLQAELMQGYLAQVVKK